MHFKTVLPYTKCNINVIPISAIGPHARHGGASEKKKHEGDGGGVGDERDPRGRGRGALRGRRLPLARLPRHGVI